MTSERPRISYTKIEEEYDADFLQDTEEIYRIKQIIKELDDVERAVLLIYADQGSMAKTGKILCVSPATICSHIQKIREKIKERL